jgi:hypothetical protein
MKRIKEFGLSLKTEIGKKLGRGRVHDYGPSRVWSPSRDHVRVQVDKISRIELL